jgi:hypothetical protein
MQFSHMKQLRGAVGGVGYSEAWEAFSQAVQLTNTEVSFNTMQHAIIC